MHLSLKTLAALWATSLPLLQAASLEEVTGDWGYNPTGAGFYIYVPDKLAAKPPVLVNPHWCHGNATDAYEGSQFATLASEYGFIVIYPNSPNTADMCWDVSSAGTLTHSNGTTGTGDSVGIANMVRYTLAKYDADPHRVFVTGISSGAMMTNVLVGVYPDIFAGGSAWAGVALGCFAPPNNTDAFDYWNSDCAEGLVVHTPAQWKAIVQAAYPGYNGWRPKMQVFHGTVDQVLNYTNFFQEINEWTGVFGFSQKPTEVTQNFLHANWTRYKFGYDDWFWATSAFNVTHNIGTNETEVMNWFDLTCVTGGCFKWGEGGPIPARSV